MLVKDTMGKETIPYLRDDEEEKKKKKVTPKTVANTTAPAVTIPDKPKTEAPPIPFNEAVIQPKNEPLNIQPANIEVQTTQAKDFTGEISNLQNDLITRAAELKRQNLRNQFQDTTRAVEQEREGLGREFATERGRIRTEGQMATRGSQAMLAGGGVADSGAMSQTAAIQSAATRGGLAQSRFQENQIRQALDNKLFEARQNMQRGISDANTQAEIKQLENELSNVQAMQESEIQRAKLADERAFKLQQDQMKFLNDAQMAQIENELEQQNMALEAQYDDALAARDNVRQQQILQQKAENDARLAAINNAARMSQIQAQGSYDIAQQELRGQQSMNELAVKSQLDREMMAAETESQREDVRRKTYNSVVNDINELNKDFFGQPADKVASIEQAINAQANNLTEQQVNDLKRSYLGVTTSQSNAGTQTNAGSRQEAITIVRQLESATPAEQDRILAQSGYTIDELEQLIK